MEFIVFLLLGIIFTNCVAGMDQNMNLSEDSLISQQTQIAFLVQKVSELSHTLEHQGLEIDDLRKENQNLIQSVSEMKRTLCPSQAVPKDLGNKAETNVDGNSARQHQGIIRKERLLVPLPQTTTPSPKENVVAFYAYMSGDFPNPGASHTLIYDTVVTNEGSGYHSATGSFIAPQTGFYVFSWTMRLANGEYHRAELVHNHKVMGVAYLYAPTGDHMVSDVVVFHVNQGDDVFVRTQTGANHGNIESGFGGRSSFTGWKLN